MIASQNFEPPHSDLASTRSQSNQTKPDNKLRYKKCCFCHSVAHGAYMIGTLDILAVICRMILAVLAAFDKDIKILSIYSRAYYWQDSRKTFYSWEWSGTNRHWGDKSVLQTQISHFVFKHVLRCGGPNILYFRLWRHTQTI